MSIIHKFAKTKLLENGRCGVVRNGFKIRQQASGQFSVHCSCSMMVKIIFNQNV